MNEFLSISCLRQSQTNNAKMFATLVNVSVYMSENSLVCWNVQYCTTQFVTVNVDSNDFPYSI